MADNGRALITKARDCAEVGSYSLAFDHYLAAFKANENLKTPYGSEFRVLMRRLTTMLEERERVDDVFEIYSRAIKIFPGNVYILNDIGELLYKYGFFMEAWDQFQKALNIDAGFVSAEIHLNSIKCSLLQRWHYRMLNDKRRNFAFRDAIKEIVTPGRDSILDLGTGSGLFTMYAAAHKPAANVGIEACSTLIRLAECILKDNQFEYVVLVHKHSLAASDVDIGGKKKFLIMEVFDAGLFGEGVIKSLDHAYDNLLFKNPKILPKTVEFFVTAIKSDILLSHYQLTAAAKQLINLPSTSKVHLLTVDEPYDCEDVHLFKDVQYISEAQSLIKVDFTNQNDIKDMLANDKQYSVKFKALMEGEVTTIIGWFNLHLTDTISLTTDPRSDVRANAWQQALFFDFVPKPVKENEEFTLSFLLAQGDKLEVVPDGNRDIMRISQAALKFLNDQEYMKMIMNCVGMAYVYLGQLSDTTELKICDLCPFPIFGLMLLKRGAGFVLCQAKCLEDKEFFEMVFKANGIEDDKYSILTGNRWPREVLGEDKYHAVFCHIFDPSGTIDSVQMDIEFHVKRNHLAQGGLCLPYNVTIMGQLIQSPWLDINNRVYDENTGFKVAKQMNKFQTSAHYCIDFAHFEYKPLAEPLVLGNCTLQMRSEVYNFPVLHEGIANAILCWYNIELMENCGYVSTQRVGSFNYGLAFLSDPVLHVTDNDVANILCCVDSDGSFKLIMDLEAT